MSQSAESSTLEQFAESHGTTESAHQAGINVTTQRIKGFLQSFAAAFEEGKAVNCMCSVLAGEDDYEFAEIAEHMEAVASGKDEEDISDDDRERVGEWLPAFREMPTLEREVIGIRQYDTSDMSPSEINELGHSGAMGLLAHNNKITGTGSVTAYDLPNGEVALIINKEQRDNGMFTVRYSGQFYGSFEVEFVDDVDEFFSSEEMHDDGWLRAKDVADGE
jgi:hypothetical protein